MVGGALVESSFNMSRLHARLFFFGVLINNVCRRLELICMLDRAVQRNVLTVQYRKAVVDVIISKHRIKSVLEKLLKKDKRAQRVRGPRIHERSRSSAFRD